MYYVQELPSRLLRILHSHLTQGAWGIGGDARVTTVGDTKMKTKPYNLHLKPYTMHVEH